MNNIYYKKVVNQRICGFYENPSLAQISQKGMIQISKEEYLRIKERFLGTEIE